MRAHDRGPIGLGVGARGEPEALESERVTLELCRDLRLRELLA